ncbi:MAG: twin-arginine translocase TatA/TatE family subunit [Planctomycetota bacterium]|nr:twin-arginine translocase TatA/TatE family subunit [Planctomycetota bacterium]
MFALLDNLGTPEIILCAIAALLVFGRRLPEVAAQAGQTLSKFRKGLDSAIQESGVEKEIQKIKQALPTDMSVRDVARAATRRVEDRMRELSAEANKIEKEVTASLTPTIDAATTEQSDMTTTSSDAQDALPDSKSTSSTGAPSARNDALTTEAPPPIKPRTSDGIDPAKNFGPPGSVPRE